MQEKQFEQILRSTIAIDSPKTQIGISIEDPINRRLVEGVAAQLGLLPIFLAEADLAVPGRMVGVELLIADESRALHFRHMSRMPERRVESFGPAVVAAVSTNDFDAPSSPNQSLRCHVDGVLTLPQPPAMVLAQLSVILYAHRAYIYRFESALEELHLNRRIFRSVTSSIVLASATEPDYPTTYVNPAFEVMTGYSLEEVLGKNCRFLQGAEHEQPGLVLIREALQEERETLAIIRNYRKDGSAFWNELSLSPIRRLDGKVTHFVSIQTDVSARIALEEALRESEKLATAGRLAASIAHEINNPLEAVTNLIYIARGLSSDPEVRNYLETADKELQRVAHITAQSLRFYRQSTKPQAIQSVDLISSVLDLYESRFAQRQIMVVRKNGRSESIVCLESEIRQVLSNLVRNAIDAIPATGGRLIVRTREATEWRSGARGIVITVADTGIGMAAETKAKLYKAFFSTKGIAGTGLGLWVSSGIVDRHHGRLLVRSRMKQGASGTVFSLFLPFQAMVK